MSMIGEARAASTAKKLEEIILEAMNGPWGDVRSAVRGFTGAHLVEWYLEECADSYGLHKPKQEILESFPNRRLK